MSDTTQAVTPEGASELPGQVLVDPATGRTTLDGELLAAPPADSVPLSRLYFR